MKIYSWNMLFRNHQIDDAFAFVRDSAFDIFCLQEVPGAFLERLKSLNLPVTYRIDGHRELENQDIYTVIISRHPLETTGAIVFPDLPHPLRVRAFIRLMRPLHFTNVSNRHGVFADVRVPGYATALRVFSLHLSLSFPEQRAREFEAAMQKRDLQQMTIVCGDFNILESPKVTLLNWLTGGRFTGSFAWFAERAAIQERFASYGLTNPLTGRITHPFSRSQLDHVLIPIDTPLTRAEVMADSHGSDHHPVLIEVAS